MNKIEEVYSIFQDFFGKEFVDLQYTNILVLFPRTTITNEYGKSTEIGKMFAKIGLSTDGTLMGTFQLLRTEFSELHFRSGYVHSHVPCLGSRISDVQSFRNPCLGIGPIKETCAQLNAEFDEDRWRLFCYELSKYVTVESVSGGPHYRMETIGSYDRFSSAGREPWIKVDYDYSIDRCIESGYRKVISKFIAYILKKEKLPISYSNNFYSIAMSPYNLTITLSNLFVDWYNTLSDSKKPEVIGRPYIGVKSLWFVGKCNNGKIYKRNPCSSNQGMKIQEYIGLPMLKFKGITYELEIPDFVNENNEEPQEETSILLAPKFAISVVNTIVRLINYGLVRNTENRNNDGSYSTYIGEDTEVII